MTAAEWSAIAATFAAISSFLIYLIQRGNLKESVRPEIVLDGWERRIEGEGTAARDVLCFKSIRNVGRGAALHIHIHMVEMGDPPTAMLPPVSHSILAPNEESEVDAEIFLWWKNVVPWGSGGKHLLINLRIYCWDTRGTRYEILYNLMAMDRGYVGIGSDEIAPGVRQGTRRVISRSVWFLKLLRRLQRHWTPMQDAIERRMPTLIPRLQRLARGWLAGEWWTMFEAWKMGRKK